MFVFCYLALISSIYCKYELWFFYAKLNKVNNNNNNKIYESILELTTCNCQRSVCDKICQYQILLLEFTYLCKCIGNCKNVFYNDQNEKKDDDEGRYVDEEYWSEIMMITKSQING